MKPIDLNEFRKQRYKEGQRVTYNPEVHPGIIERLAILGRTQQEIANVIGVRKNTFQDWIANHQEVATAFQFGSDLANADVVAALYDNAVGWYDENTKRRKGANVTAQIWWLKNRCGWRDQQPLNKSDDEKDESDVTPEAISQAAKALIRILEGHGEAAPVMIDATPATTEKPEDEFKEFDE